MEITDVVFMFISDILINSSYVTRDVTTLCEFFKRGVCFKGSKGSLEHIFFCTKINPG